MLETRKGDAAVTDRCCALTSPRDGRLAPFFFALLLQAALTNDALRPDFFMNHELTPMAIVYKQTSEERKDKRDEGERWDCFDSCVCVYCVVCPIIHGSQRRISSAR
jgi:hypothetical protein